MKIKNNALKISIIQTTAPIKESRICPIILHLTFIPRLQHQFKNTTFKQNIIAICILVKLHLFRFNQFKSQGFEKRNRRNVIDCRTCGQSFNVKFAHVLNTYMITHKLLTLTEIFEDCQNKFDNDKPAFISLLKTHIDLDEMIPITFHNHFYASTGSPRKYSLKSLLWGLIIQRIFSIPTDRFLLTFLTYSKPLREFCGFTKVPDARLLIPTLSSFETKTA